MKRRLFKLAAFLLAGAIVNVAVAWGCVAIETPIAPAETAVAVEGECYKSWIVHVYEAPGLQVFTSGWRSNVRGPSEPTRVHPQAFLAHWCDFLYPQSDDSKEIQLFLADARGWPFVSLYSAFEFEASLVSINDLNSTRLIRPNRSVTRDRNGYLIAVGDPIATLAGIPIESTANRGPLLPHRFRAIPTQPIWISFAINSMMYASAIGLCWTAIATFKHRIRKNRGQCPTCTYPIGTSAVCTECGCELHKGNSSTASDVQNA